MAECHAHSPAVMRYHSERRRAARLLDDAISEALQGEMRVNAARIYRQYGNEAMAIVAEKCALVWFDRAESLFDAAVDAEQRATAYGRRPLRVD